MCLFVLWCPNVVFAFQSPLKFKSFSVERISRHFASEWKEGEGEDSNKWISSNDEVISSQNEDWQEVITKKADGSFWSSFEPINDNNNELDLTPISIQSTIDEDTMADAWLETLASLSAEEIEFNLKEADRADKARQMAEWGFDDKVIEATLGVATTTELEKDEVKGMQEYRQEAYLEEIDLEVVESHTTVEIDEETGEPIRARMVYVDEHTCIGIVSKMRDTFSIILINFSSLVFSPKGCTHCAMIAQSTFFMHSEHGRSRVFQQWGDDDETIQIAIETCPVDCIHYIPYEELVSLEVDRRNQNINPKARLVSQAENGNNLSHRVGGAVQFTAPQQISGNMLSRCSNCPTRGCKTCPMYGVGKNPEYELKEKERKERTAKRKLQKQRELEEKSIEL